MKYQVLFYQKNNEKNSRRSSAAVVFDALRVKGKICSCRGKLQADTNLKGEFFSHKIVAIQLYHNAFSLKMRLTTDFSFVSMTTLYQPI